MVPTTSVVSFSHLLATTFFKTPKLVWYIKTGSQEDWRREELQLSCLLSRLILFFRIPQKMNLSGAPRCRWSTQNDQQPGDVYPFASCYIHSCLSLKNNAAGQNNLIRGIHVGTKQQFMHLAGSSVALGAKLPGPWQTTGGPCPDTPGVHILSCFIL